MEDVNSLVKEFFMKSSCLVLLCSLLSLVAGNCTVSSQSKGSKTIASPTSATIGSPTPGTSGRIAATDTGVLCKQLAELKQFPGRDPSEEKDPIYTAFMAKGKEMVPCLLEQ